MIELIEIGITVILLPLWIVLICYAIFTLSGNIRRKFLAKPILRYLKQALPAMSQTEQEALEAGDVWWEGELFSGEPNWNYLLDYPKPELTAKERAFIDNQVNTLCSKLDDWQIITKEKDLPTEIWDYLKQEKFFGMVIPEAFGGLGFSALAHSTIVSRIATRSVSAAVTTMVPNSLGPGELILHYGTKEQQQYYLPRLAQGDEIPCFALTSEEAGSDASAMTDHGVVCKGEYKGKKVTGIKLTWHKRYISLAPVATVIGLAVKLYDPDGILGDQKELGITVCLIPADEPGIEIGKRHLPLNLAFMNGPIRGSDVFIPLDFIIGGKEKIGHGWRMLMACLAVGRAISLPALSCAAGSMAYRMTGAYAAIRRQFNTPIGSFEGITEGLAKIAGLTYLLEAVRLLTITAVDNGVKPSVASAIAKCHMTEMNREIIELAMDIHGGKAIQMGPKNYLAHAYFAVPLGITVEGANILTRNLIIFGQGAIRCHPYLQREIALAQAQDLDSVLNEFDEILYKHIVQIMQSKVKAFVAALIGTWVFRVPVKNKAAKFYRQLTRYSHALFFVSNVALIFLGGKLKRKERLSARLGDVFSYLYIASAVLKFYRDTAQCPQDDDQLEWAMQYCSYNIEQALGDALHNFPIPVFGLLLKLVVFPLGFSAKKPSDALDARLAQAMMRDDIFRDKLTQNCYIGTDEESAIGRVECAFKKVLAAEAAEKKFSNCCKKETIAKFPTPQQQLAAAVNAQLLTEHEAQLIEAAWLARQRVVEVDEFSKAEIQGLFSAKQDIGQKLKERKKRQ